MLGDTNLEQVQMLESDEDQIVTHHPVVALDGGFVQTIGRRAARFRLTGVLTASPISDRLTELRTKFMNAQPVPFVSDISAATLVDEVLIEEMTVRELAGSPDRLEYHFVLREYTEAEPSEPAVFTVPPAPIPEVEHGSLSVTVIVEGDPNFNFDRVAVSVEGTADDGSTMSRRRLDNRISGDVWLEEELPAGQYRVDALVDDNRTATGASETLTGSASTQVENGEVATVTIVLRRGSKIGTVFAVHFRFDSAFVEPCMRPVLRQVVEYAAAHPNERLLIIGHTDLVDTPVYNQSLSERRGRSVYAHLTHGASRQPAIDEWNELRRRPSGGQPTSRDRWGSREYQHMLQDLGYFKGNVGKDFGLTDEAVRRFQASNGLDPDGDVGDLTWPVLIDKYLAQDGNGITADRFLQNADDTGCDQGPLRWLGCSEHDPVNNTQGPWRPNRRAELMFVKEHILPCQVPKPVTLNLIDGGAGGGSWCLDDGTAKKVCCFVTAAAGPCPPQESERWCRKPAESGTFPVSGRLQFSDGSPVADQRYVLTAPDGQYMDGEAQANSGDTWAGTGLPGRTDGDGRFSYTHQKGVGIYTVEVDDQFVVHRLDQSASEATGNTVCVRLDGSADLIAVVVDRAALTVSPTVTGPAAVVVKKSHTNPARQAIRLGVSAGFSGTGTLSRSSDTVRFFDAVAGGNEILFDGTDNVFTDAQLVGGHQIYAEGARASAAVGDVSLTLTVGGQPGLAATHRMTSVEVTLDVHMSRTSQAALPPPVAEADKVASGRFVHRQDPGNHAGRAMLTVRRAKPEAFVGNLVLRALDGRVRIFGQADEVAAAGQAPVATPLTVASAATPPAGSVFWVEGVTVSAALRDSGFQLGLENVEADGDRIAATVVQLSNLTAQIPATPARTARLGNSPVPSHAFTVGAAFAAADFDEDFTVNSALPLVENSVVAGTPVQLSVNVAPAGTPVLWSTQRASGLPAAGGGDDDPVIVALTPRSTPTLTVSGANPLQATLLADNVGSFHIRPFVDGNGNGTFDHRIDREPNIIMNLILGRVTLHRDTSIARSNNFTVNPLAGGGLVVDSGSFLVNSPATTAMHMNAQIDVVTGGSKGRRDIDQFHGGWINNVTGPNVATATYTDTTVAPPTVHPAPRVFASNTPPSRVFVPGGAAPALIAPPVLDSGRGAAAGSGGDSATLGQSRIRTRVPRPLGQRWIVEAVDSPALRAAGQHPGRPNPRLTGFSFSPAFEAFLAVWTNRSATITPTGDPADRVYAVVRRITWLQNGQWTIVAATGAIVQTVAPTTAAPASTTTSPAVAAPATGVEVRPPVAVPNLGLDAQA